MAETLTIVDNRTGATYEIPVTNNTIRATDLKQVRVADAPGLSTYDPGLVNTSSVKSAVTYIDGDAGILEYRGYPIEQLAEQCTYLEVAYLLLHGELPTQEQLTQWQTVITKHTFLPENITEMVRHYRYDAHPMAVLMSAVAGMHTFYPDGREYQDEETRWRQIHRLIAKMPTLAAFAYRKGHGLPLVYPRDDRNYVQNFLTMLFQVGEPHYEVDPRLERALEVLFILHADHEQNCSANAVRAVASSGNDPYTSVSAGIGALFGPLHGAANQAVMEGLNRIGSVANVPGYIAKVKAGEERLMGFGHRVYKNYDPRARIIKKAAEEVFEVTGVNPKLQIALELEKIALEDDYFVSRKLYPNVDFYSGLIYEALGFPPEMYTVLFAIPRTSGWLAQWQEQMTDPEQKIVRPKQIYTGHRGRDVVPLAERG
ncbi:citrate synthase [Granulicoccus phenolivorans]|uniref:citrate synthase n=1 Tax=Granulicoccus phenolivorans TaxID=266854 RepID=UPI00047E01D9|nr:citrate synthase [Granulicoccus phenolivorans]